MNKADKWANLTDERIDPKDWYRVTGTPIWEENPAKRRAAQAKWDAAKTTVRGGC